MKNNTTTKGFTLIELLIVIAVLGILAVAVLSAINPIEQINRSRDTGTRSDAEQLISAIDRYYAGKGYYPWAQDANSDATEVALTEIDGTQPIGTDDQDVLDKLSAGGTAELKESFVNRIISGNNHLFIANAGQQGDSTYVCFVPKSSSFRDEAWVRCTNTNGLPSDYPAAACPADSCSGEDSSETATACYICLP